MTDTYKPEWTMDMLSSACIDQLLPAFITARAAIPPVRKSSVNEHFGNRYADLHELEAAALPALLAQGLMVVHHYARDDRGGLLLVTRLYHQSGQWLQSAVPIGADKSSQALGSGSTYAKRYSLQALLSLAADEDDDGNSIADGVARERPALATRRTSQSLKPTVPKSDPAVELIERVRACSLLADLAALTQEINLGAAVATKRNATLRAAIVERRAQLEQLAQDAVDLGCATGGEP
ncbi:MAG TPA: ERF family protein [Lysobacter sp.]